MTEFVAEIVIEAEDREQAEKVLGARIDYDEDLTKDGVENYSIYVNGDLTEREAA
jgi:hypothetical protein